jgi:hypothetical protein
VDETQDAIERTDLANERVVLAAATSILILLD